MFTEKADVTVGTRLAELGFDTSPEQKIGEQQCTQWALWRATLIKREQWIVLDLEKTLDTLDVV